MSNPSRIGRVLLRPLFGQSILGHTLAYLLALLTFVLGMAVGMNITQPIAVIEPTQSLIKTLESFDKKLAAAHGDLRNVSKNVEMMRSKIEDLKLEPESVSQRQAIDIYKMNLSDQLTDIENTLRSQSEEFANQLEQSRFDLRQVKDDLDRQIKSSDGFATRVYDQVRRFLKWVGPIVFGSLLGLLIIILAFCHPAIRQFLGKSGSISFGGLTLNFQDLLAVRENVQNRLKALDRDISNIYLDNLRSAQVEDQFADVKADLDLAFLTIETVTMAEVPHRATLFVPGFSGDELVQATGYLGAKMSISRYTAGRRFSVRYGMIGKAWRLRFSQYNPSVDNLNNNLVRNFGVTQGEAARMAPASGGGNQRKGALMSFAVMGKHDDAEADPLGVIYIEAYAENVLTPKKDVDHLKTIDPGNLDGMSFGDLAAQAIWNSIARSPSVARMVDTLSQLRRDFDWDTKLVPDAGR